MLQSEELWAYSEYHFILTLMEPSREYGVKVLA